MYMNSLSNSSSSTDDQGPFPVKFETLRVTKASTRFRKLMVVLECVRSTCNAQWQYIHSANGCGFGLSVKKLTNLTEQVHNIRFPLHRRRKMFTKFTDYVPFHLVSYDSPSCTASKNLSTVHEPRRYIFRKFLYAATNS